MTGGPPGYWEKHRYPPGTTMPPDADPEAAPDRRQFDTGAVRSLDAEATRYDLISPVALRALAETCAEGAAKYGDFN